MENVMICVNTYCLNFKYKINDMFNISILLLITIYLIKKSFNINVKIRYAFCPIICFFI